MTRQKRIELILARLSRVFTNPETALEHSTPWELLVATVLSAQTTDAHVNKVTKGLFRKYRSIGDYADAPLDVLQDDLSSINFYRNKAKNIQNAARMIRERFSGNVPDTMEALIDLPGVARKTANIILWNAYGKNEGIAVDTHVKRLAGRLGLTKHTDPVKIERDLMKDTPRDEWGRISHYLILHGRTVCTARGPKHDECVLKNVCPSKEI